MQLKGLGQLALVVAAVVGLLVGCKSDAGQTDAHKQPRVVATTTMIADLAQEIGGEHVSVTGIMKPGGDPHLYQPTPNNARTIAQADLVLTHGLHLEGWIDDLIENAGGNAVVRPVTAGLKPLSDPLRTGYPDPHVWHDPIRWKVAAVNVRDALVKLDPTHAEAYKRNAADRLERLDALDSWVRARVERIPESRRVLVTSHDAFQYYGDRYNLDVVAVQGVSTESEAGTRDVARIVEIVRARRVSALFVETSVNPKLVEQISRETGANIGGTLYSDSLGASNTAGGTYDGMIKANTERIVRGLAAESALRTEP